MQPPQIALGQQQRHTERAIAVVEERHARTRMLLEAGPLYALFGLGMGLYFASQGFGRLRWAVVANFARLAIAVGGGWVALRTTGDLTSVFNAVALGLAAFGLTNAAALATRAVVPRVDRSKA
jgi:hypothetical protein